MLGESLDAAEASFRVGYESPTQFSREYRRLFGAPPHRDIEALRKDQAPSNLVPLRLGKKLGKNPLGTGLPTGRSGALGCPA